MAAPDRANANDEARNVAAADRPEKKRMRRRNEDWVPAIANMDTSAERMQKRKAAIMRVLLPLSRIIALLNEMAVPTPTITPENRAKNVLAKPFAMDSKSPPSALAPEFRIEADVPIAISASPTPRSTLENTPKQLRNDAIGRVMLLMIITLSHSKKNCDQIWQVFRMSAGLAGKNARVR